MAGPHASPPVTLLSRPSSDPEAMPVSAQGSYLQKGTNPHSTQPQSPPHSPTGAPALFPDDHLVSPLPLTNEQQHHRQQQLVQQHHPAQQRNRMINTSRTRRNGNGNSNSNGNGNGNADGRSRGRRGKRRRSPLRILTSILYHTSFSFFLLVLAVILVVSAFGLSDQALRGPASVGLGNQRFLNFVITMGSYVVLAIISIAHVWSRLLSIKKILRTMPKPYIPTKQMDVPKKVADHIMAEYSRTAVIAHISQATKGSQEGWGRPGTKWENQHFRTYILGTISSMLNNLPPGQALAPSSPGPAHALSPILDAADQMNDQGATRLFVNSWVLLIDQARYGKREPTEVQAAACEMIVDAVFIAHTIIVRAAFCCEEQGIADLRSELRRQRERETEGHHGDEYGRS